MDNRGGCCIARYHGGTTTSYDLSKVERIMLRFRPIAPKPTILATSGSVSGGTSPDKSTSNTNTNSVGRPKRRYNSSSSSGGSSGKKGNIGRKKRVVSSETKGSQNSGYVTTLPLLQEKPMKHVEQYRPLDLDHHLDLTIGKTNLTNPTFYVPAWRTNDRTMKETTTTTVPQPVRPVGSCVVVECVTDTCQDIGDVLGKSDEERRERLEGGTCPGFISDMANKVTWTNEAYRKMVNKDGWGEAKPEMVWLVTKEKLLVVTERAFACRVRLQYTWRKERCCLTVPCDVWRLGNGGFAWRLDVKAALSLGR